MTLETSINNPMLRRRMLRFTVGIFSLYAIYSLILVPLNTHFGSNIVYAGTMLLELTELLYEIIELLAYAYAFAALINTRFCFGLRGAFCIFWIYLGAALFRYVSIFLISGYMSGINMSNLWLELLFLLAYVLLDATQMIVVFVGAHLLCLTYERVFTVRAKAQAARGEPVKDKCAYVVPYGGTLSMKNPLQASAVLCGIVILLARVIGRIIYDVSYGAPTGAADVAWMVFYYLGDITVSVLCCALIMLIIRRMDCRTAEECAASDTKIK